MRFDTTLVQAGERPIPGTGDIVAPVHLATVNERGPQDPPTYYYARGENPTRERLEDCLAALEGARHAAVFSSGQAAAATLLSLFGPGQRAVVSTDVYSGTTGLFTQSAAAGLDVRYADLADRGTAASTLGSGGGRIDLVWIETPGNPLLSIVDLEAVCRLAHERGARVVVDNTVASPALQQPLRFADVSLYSTTKSIAGHMDVLGGALVHDDEALQRQLLTQRALLGNVPGTFDCYSIRRGVKTLGLRVQRQCESALRIATVLKTESSVTEVLYPGLAAHPGHDVAARQMSGFGPLLAFRYAGDVARLLESVKLYAVAVSLGGVQSLIECPAKMSHRSLPAELRRRQGISEDLVRVSVGIEDPEDLVQDLTSALREGSK